MRRVGLWWWRYQARRRHTYAQTLQAVLGGRICPYCCNHIPTPEHSNITIQNSGRHILYCGERPRWRGGWR